MRWQEILEYFLSASVFGAVIAYLGKTAIDAFVAGRIESYKKNLERITAEHAVRFQRLHSDRADIIRTLYEKLSKLDDVLMSTLAPFQPVNDASLEKKVQLLANHYREARDYFVPRRIFFDAETCSQVDRVLEIASGIFFDVTVHEIDVNNKLYEYDRGVLMERHIFWEKARASHKNDFVSLKQSLENQFRSLLGIEA